MPKIVKNGKEYSGVPIEVVTAWQPTSDPVQVKEPLMGNTDISSIGDGSVTGAISAVKSGLTNVGIIENLGTKQGTGTATLSSSISNFRFLYIRVGYYSSGFPNYGTAFIPVNGLNLTSDTTYAIAIPIYESAAGCVRVGFNNATTLRVDSTYNADRYVTVFGVK